MKFAYSWGVSPPSSHLDSLPPSLESPNPLCVFACNMHEWKREEEEEEEEGQGDLGT